MPKGQRQGRGVSDRQMRDQYDRVSGGKATYEDKRIKRAARDFAELNEGSYYSNSEDLYKVYQNFENFASVSDERNPLFTSTTRVKGLRFLLGALILANMVSQTTADVFQAEFEKRGLPEGDIGGSAPSRHYLRGGNTAVAAREARESEAVALPVPGGLSAEERVGDGVMARSAELGRPPRPRRTRESGESRALLSAEETMLHSKINKFTRDNPGAKISIADLARKSGFLTLGQSLDDGYTIPEGYTSETVDLGDALFEGINLDNADFKDTLLGRVEFEKCSLVRASFAGQRFRDLILLKDCNCDGATFKGSKGGVLVGSTAVGGSSFMDTNFNGVDITLEVSNLYGDRLPDDREHRPSFKGSSWDGAKVRLEMYKSARPTGLARDLCFEGAAEVTSVTYPGGVTYYSVGAWGVDDGIIGHSLAGETVICDDTLVSGAVVTAAQGNATAGRVGLTSGAELCRNVHAIQRSGVRKEDGRPDGAGYVGPGLSPISQSQLATFTSGLSKLFGKLGVNADVINLDALKQELTNSATSPERAGEINGALAKFSSELADPKFATDLENICQRAGGDPRDPLFISEAVFPGSSSDLAVEGDDVKSFLRTFLARIGIARESLDPFIASLPSDMTQYRPGSGDGPIPELLRKIYGGRAVVPEPSPTPKPPSHVYEEVEGSGTDWKTVGIGLGAAAGAILLICVACCCCNGRTREATAEAVVAGGAVPHGVVPAAVVPPHAAVAPQGGGRLDDSAAGRGGGEMTAV